MNFETLTDQQVIDFALMANRDCIEAGTKEPNSEWHEACFAAMVVVSQEMSRRGISLNKTH